MLSGTSGSDTGPRASQAALLATQMNEARRQQQRHHLSVLEPSVKLPTQGIKNNLLPNSSISLRSPGHDNATLSVSSTPPPKKRLSAFENAESELSTPSPRMNPSSSYAPQLQTPKRLSSNAAIASHGPAISIISPDRNFPRLHSDISHESPQPLPNASSRRDLALYPKESIDDDSATAVLLSSSSNKLGDKRTAINPSQSYREDIRLRPLLQLTEVKPHSAGSLQSFTASSQRSEQDDELPERFATAGRWNDVYCACFGKRIC